MIGDDLVEGKLAFAQNFTEQHRVGTDGQEKLAAGWLVAAIDDVGKSFGNGRLFAWC